MGNSRPLYLTIIFLLLLVIAGEGYMFFGKGYANSRPKTAQEYYYSLPDSITTNLRDDGRYVRLSVVFSTTNGKLSDELEKKNGIIRNSIISILANQSASDVSGEKGQDRLRKLIEKSVNGILQTGKIDGVYFSDFVVQ